MHRTLFTATVLLAAVCGVLVANEQFKQTLKTTFQDQRPTDVRRELLWPAGAPGARGDSENDKPSIDWYLPADGARTGAAVIVLPGGGYGGLAMGHEGREVGEFFRSRGVAAFVVRYRLGAAEKGGYRHPVMMHDAQRAVRYVRHHASKAGIEPKRIGLMGFSAGGHLASTVGTHFDSGNPSAEDPIDRQSCRPDFLILCYPVVSFTAPFTHQGSARNLLGDNPDPALLENLSNEKQVTSQTPPTFLFHTDEDTGVPPQNSIAFYLALKEHRVPAELHIYRTGPHGVGLAPQFPLLRDWPELLINWMQGLGVIKVAGE
jgi:acetyl esterase/lipase